MNTSHQHALQKPKITYISVTETDPEIKEIYRTSDSDSDSINKKIINLLARKLQLPAYLQANTVHVSAYTDSVRNTAAAVLRFIDIDQKKYVSIMEKQDPHLLKSQVKKMVATMLEHIERRATKH